MANVTDPPPEIQQQLLAAAEHRAAGTAWTATALHVGTPDATLRGWTKRYPNFWKQILQEARQATIEEAEAEAICILRTQLRTAEEKLQIDAAKKLIDHSEHQRPKAQADHVKSSPLVAIAAYLEGLSDEQVDQHLAELRDRSESRSTVAKRPPRPKGPA